MLERSVEWIQGKKSRAMVKLIDQTSLPFSFKRAYIKNVDQMVEAIRTMVVRGAPAIGAAAGMAMALAAINSKARTKDELMDHLARAKRKLDGSRPTAVNLAWATSKILAKSKILDGKVPTIIRGVIREAKKIADEDVGTNQQIGSHGAELLSDGDMILTHCNAGAIATVGFGTALGVVRAAVAMGKQVTVLADETRPRFQGARLTCWEMQQEKIPVIHITDNQAGLLMKMGKVSKVLVGADRIVNDAVFNKVGTYGVAIMAKYHAIPFYVAAPRSTLDLGNTSETVEIEQRDPAEVKIVLNKVRLSPDGVPAFNYAFDATPMELITGVITEDGVFTPEALLANYSEQSL